MIEGHGPEREAPSAESMQVLMAEAAMQYYEAIRLEEGRAHPVPEGHSGPPGETLWRMAQLTWPFQVMRFKPKEHQTRPRYVVFFVRGMGMEEDLWMIPGDRRERDAIRLSILLRNMYSAGNRDALRHGNVDEGLAFALPAVREVNAVWSIPEPEGP